MAAQLLSSAQKLFAGMLTSPTPQSEQRLAVCNACPDLKGDGLVKRCGLCGCVVAAKAKLASEHCPRGLW